jgi:uncharacterized NAD(P)/FAD-binding protein YdhS
VSSDHLQEFDVAIVGAGASGTLVAAQLRNVWPESRVALIGNAARPARGIAYDTPYQSHLLNVHAENMSAFPDDRDHFTRWLIQRRPTATGADFAPRTWYGDYLAEILAEALRAPTPITPITGEVVSVMRYGDRWLLQLADGTALMAHSVVLAVGNLPPNDPPGFSADLPGYWSNPWASDVARRLAVDAPVLIIGTGLTMVDVVLALSEVGHCGPIAALSQHGRLYQPHASYTPRLLTSLPAEFASPRRALRWLRIEIERAQREGNDWRAVIDSLRPHTEIIWRQWSLAQRASFVRHGRNLWDIHRHRVPPQVGTQLDEWIAQGTLTIHAGRVLAADATPQGVKVCWLPKDSDQPQQFKVARVINCTGPNRDYSRVNTPLVTSLRKGGWLTPDPLRLGWVTDIDGRLIGVDGSSVAGLYTIGPLRLADLWESIAIPEIRVQAAALANVLVAESQAEPLPA